jgi:hypothetical protein
MDKSTHRKLAEAYTRKADALTDIWNAMHDEATARHGGGPPWKKTNVPEGSRYLAGAAWSHWPAETRSDLLKREQEIHEARNKAREHYLKSGGRSWMKYYYEHSRTR